MFDWFLNPFLLPVKNNEKLFYIKKKLYGPFLWMGFNCIKGTEPPRRDSLLFTTQETGVFGIHLIILGRMKGCPLPSSHPVVLNLGLLDWESSTLTTMVIEKR